VWAPLDFFKELLSQRSIQPNSTNLRYDTAFLEGLDQWQMRTGCPLLAFPRQVLHHSLYKLLASFQIVAGNFS
jgi:hypothetical protein